MCEIFSLNFIDTALSIVIFIMNIIYTVWGWLMPNEEEVSEELSNTISKLKSYLNFVTYSDTLTLPIKIIIMILIEYFICKASKDATSKDVKIKSCDRHAADNNLSKNNNESDSQRDYKPDIQAAGNTLHKFNILSIHRNKNIVEV